MPSLRAPFVALSSLLFAAACTSAAPPAASEPGGVIATSTVAATPTAAATATVAATATAATTAVATASPPASPSPRSTPEPCVPPSGAEPPFEGSFEATIALGCGAGAVAVAGDSIWSVPHLDRVMLRIDPKTNTIRQRISLGDRGPGAEIAANDGMVWASVSSPSYDLERLVHVDPATGEVVGFVDVAAGFPIIAGDSVWATSDGQVHRIDPISHTVSASIELGDCGLVTDGERLWCIGSDVAFWLDPDTNQAEPIEIAAEEQLGLAVEFAGGSIWGTNAEHLWALDPDSGTIVAQIERPDGIATWGIDGAVLDGALWIAGRSTPGDVFREPPDRLLRIDVAGMAVDCVMEIPAPEFGIDAGFGSLWLPVIRQPWLLRVRTEC